VLLFYQVEKGPAGVGNPSEERAKRSRMGNEGERHDVQEHDRDRRPKKSKVKKGKPRGIDLL